MHCVHNEEAVETCADGDSATTCAENNAPQKQFSDAYQAGDYPPEITEVRLSAAGLSVHTNHTLPARPLTSDF